MPSGPQKYRILVVQDGDQFGILIERQIGQAQPEWAYFTPEGDEYLHPTSEIRNLCGPRCYPPVTRELDVRMLKELRDYTVAASASGDMNSPRELSQDYSYDSHGYPGFLNKFFGGRRSELCRFFRSAAIFKAKVLEKVHKEERVIGRAKEFAVRSPLNIFPEENLRLLLTMERVLKVNAEESSKWFRKSGPIAVDFEAGTVFRRSECLEQLKEFALHHHISILEGPAATGKTVLVRHLMYDIHNDGSLRVFCVVRH